MRRRVELVLHPRAQRAGRRHATAIAEPAAVVEQPVAADQGAARQTSRMAWVAGGGRRAGVLHLRRRRQLPQKRVGGSMTTPENVGSRTASNVSLLSLSAPEILQRPAPQPGAPLFGAPRPECPRAPANPGIVGLRPLGQGVGEQARRPRRVPHAPASMSAPL